MLSIGEFSKASGLTVKTLRFYHDRKILTPALVDPQSGYRYYDDRNLETARIIRALRELEFTLDDIAAILAECGEDQDPIAYLERHRIQLAEKFTHYQNLLQRVDLAISNELETRETTSMRSNNFDIKEEMIEEQLIAGVRMKGAYSECGAGFSKLAKQVGRHICGKPLFLCYDQEFREDDAEFEACYPVRKKIALQGAEVRNLPATRCITLKHRGSYDSLGTSYAKLLEYAKRNKYEIVLPTREVYLKGPGMIFRGNPKKYLTEIQLPIK